MYLVKTPTIPSSLTPSTTSVTSSAVTLSWSSVTNGDEYQLEMSKNGGGYTSVYSGGGLSQSVSISAGTHIFRLRACNVEQGAKACSGYKYSTDVYKAEPPGYGTVITAPSSSYGAVNITWDIDISGIPQEEVNGARLSINEYQLDKKINNVYTRVYNGTSRSKSLSLSSGVYQFRVRACKKEGTAIACDPWKETTNNTIVVIAPSIPTFTQLTDFSTSGAGSVSWSKPQGEVSSYTLQQLKTGGSWLTVLNGTSGIFNYSLPDGVYHYRVRACNTVSNLTSCSDFTESSSVEVLRPPSEVTMGYLPKELHVSKNINLKWQENQVSDKYKLFIKRGTNSYGQNVLSTNKVLSYSTGISGTDTYTFKVVACFIGAQGESCSVGAESSIIKPVSIAKEVFVYDSIGRLISVQTANGSEASYTYDDAGNRKTSNQKDGN